MSTTRSSVGVAGLFEKATKDNSTAQRPHTRSNNRSQIIFGQSSTPQPQRQLKPHLVCTSSTILEHMRQEEARSNRSSAHGACSNQANAGGSRNDFQQSTQMTHLLRHSYQHQRHYQNGIMSRTTKSVFQPKGGPL